MRPGIEASGLHDIIMSLGFFPRHVDDLAQTGTHSPPLRPTNISTPEDVARQGRVPVSPSSPRQPV